MIPGMAHCGGGIGPDRHDPVTAVIEWVEKGRALARYKDDGSIDDAANFRCEMPR